jgi:hypothetical protein
MKRYTILLLNRPDGKPGGSEITVREERQFANLGEALQRGRKMYQSHESSAIGFRVCDAAGTLIHEWRR